MRKLQIGIIGAGGVARTIHVPGLLLCPEVRVAAVADPDPAAARALADQAEGAAECGAYPELLARPGLDAVVVATPNFLHHEIVLAALAAGKHVLCEKPLALNATDAREMAAQAHSSGLVHMTAFTYRYTPALQYLGALVRAGELGRLRTLRAAYQMALSKHLLGWRSTVAQAGSGVLADIGSHLVHMVQFVAGDVVELTASKRRFRDDPASDVEDWISFLAEFESGACGTFEISRVCAGHGAGISEDIFLEVYGTRGSALFSLQDPWGLQVVAGEAAEDPSCVFERRAVPAEYLKIPGSPRDVAAHDRRLGYRFDQAWQFVESVRKGEVRAPSLEDGAKCQAVLDAALRSCESRGWTRV